MSWNLFCLYKKISSGNVYIQHLLVCLEQFWGPIIKNQFVTKPSEIWKIRDRSEDPNIKARLNFGYFWKLHPGSRVLFPYLRSLFITLRRKQILLGTRVHPLRSLRSSYLRLCSLSQTQAPPAEKPPSCPVLGASVYFFAQLGRSYMFAVSYLSWSLSQCILTDVYDPICNRIGPRTVSPAVPLFSVF